MTLPYHETFTRNHIPIWIGKNARSNDILTFQLAHPNDLWFHTIETPGAHVILRTQGILVPTATDIQEASDCARRHSSGANIKQGHPQRRSHLSVHCVNVSQVYKTKYDKPGQVRIQQNI